MEKNKLFRPKLNEESRIINVRAMRAYVLGLVEELDAKRPIGPELREETDYLEASFMLYKRYRNRPIGRRYPYWWTTTYDSRLRSIHHELLEDVRQEEQEKAGEP